MLVQPFEPSREFTNQWDLQDPKGVYIIRELVKAAKAVPSGSFVEYDYYLPGVFDVQKKLAYVVGLPELECYIGTGMYMEKAIQEQKEILSNVEYLSLWLLVAVLSPLSISIYFIVKRNRLLTAEVEVRKKAEQDLKRGEEKYRSIFENAVEGIYQTTVEGRLIGVNPAFARVFGYESPKEMIESVANIARHYADPSERQKLFHALNEKGVVQNYVLKMKRKDGRDIWISTNARVVRDEQGNILHYEGTIEDITIRKEAEERTLQAEDKFAKVFITTPDCVVIFRMEDGRIVDANRGFEEISGWKREEVLGRTCLDFHLWGDPVQSELMMVDLRAGRDVLYRESQFRRKDGSSCTAIYSARSIHIAGDLCCLFILQDITDRRRLEEERRKLERQLYQSQKMDAIGQLAGGMAHDFNNLLMGIQGNASMMLMEYSPAHPHYQRLSQIEEQVKRGANLTRQLLGFAREGKYELKSLSVNELLRKSALFFIETRKEIYAEFQLPEDVDSIEADPAQMEQVLLNIYINAGHAMPKGGRLHIETSNETLEGPDAAALDIAPGKYVKICITDSGTGMDAETLKRIFEPFFTTKSQDGGSGLGLASAYGIMRNHGGVITAYSELGRGSTFRLYLPSSGRAVEREEEKPPEGELISGTGGILLVDDEPAILGLASELLKRLGYTVYRAENGREAVSIYREKRDEIDLVILDMILQGMNGAEVLKMLREVSDEVKVVLSSGYGLQGEVRKVMEMGCLGFIQKPYNFRELSSLVHQVLHS